MKKWILFLCLVLPLAGFSQIPIGDLYDPIGSKGNRLPDRIIFDFHYGMWLDAPQGTEVGIGWPGLNLYTMFDRRFTENSLFSVAAGFGLGSDNIHTNARFLTLKDPVTNEEFVDLVPWHSSYKFRKNKMVLNYFDFPVEFRFKSPSRWRIHLGGKFGFLLSAHDKRVDDEGKYKNYNIPYLSPFRYGVHARIGRKRINFNGYYSLSPLFKDGRGIELYTFTFGMSLLLL